jgi:hypothetical protein
VCGAVATKDVDDGLEDWGPEADADAAAPARF